MDVRRRIARERVPTMLLPRIARERVPAQELSLSCAERVPFVERRSAPKRAPSGRLG